MANISAVTSRLRDLAESDTIPSNVKEMLQDAAEQLEDDEKDISVRVNSAASLLDQVSNDPNIRQHTRTEIWNIASKVESLDD